MDGYSQIQSTSAQITSWFLTDAPATRVTPRTAETPSDQIAIEARKQLRAGVTHASLPKKGGGCERRRAK